MRQCIKTPTTATAKRNGNLGESNACVHHLCSNVTNYPTVDVNTIIKKKKEFHHFFGSVIEPYSPPEILGKAPVYGATEDQNMCPVKTYKLSPQTALSVTMKRVVIVNVEDFKQVVSFEVCIPNKKCFMDDRKPLFYETFCKQQYTLIRLVTVAESGDLILDNVPIPSSCVCSYKRTV
ncbi:uncharacterized protein LOC116179102 isoform X2 [Photinus pyralis]|uniref:uncharacterized protein LOC116179102 isoform X2 n=1 Tax=Photinus pyralis TaxID=7054 RepID=UPI001266E6AB|nr:uncharacterized protein LOC116179102 isoform X2 [Photinus pyralis]